MTRERKREQICQPIRKVPRTYSCQFVQNEQVCFLDRNLTRIVMENEEQFAENVTRGSLVNLTSALNDSANSEQMALAI